MLGHTKIFSKKPGLPPGTLVHVGEKKVEKVRLRIIDYDEENLEERELEAVEECFPYKDKRTVTWINIDGLHQVDIVEEIGKNFGLHHQSYHFLDSGFFKHACQRCLRIPPKPSPAYNWNT